MTLEILAYGFIQRSLIAGTAIAILCAVVGIFLVLRRYSLFGDAVAHTAFGGIALGLLVGVYPLWTAYLVSVAGALVITRIRSRFQISGDASIAVLLSSGIAVGLVLMGLSGGPSVDILSFIFGSILLVGATDTVIILALTGSVLVVILLLYRQLVYSTFNEEQARVSGIRVDAINYLVVFIAGITVVTSIQLVGILLISALLVIPNISAIMYGRGFRDTMLISIAFSASSVVSGILISYALDMTPSGTIVLVAVAIFAVTLGLRRMSLISG